MNTFVSTTGCPTAEALDAYSSGRLAQAERTRVGRHLAACDFCGAASQLLAARPRVDEVAPAEVPPPLLVLLLAGSLPGPSEQSATTRLRRAA